LKLAWVKSSLDPISINKLGMVGGICTSYEGGIGRRIERSYLKNN
jgi:hypothetical protein